MRSGKAGYHRLDEARSLGADHWYSLWVTSSDMRCEDDCPRNLDAGMGQLASGMAWHFKRYANEQTEEQRLRYAFAEEEARAKKARLWINENPMPP